MEAPELQLRRFTRYGLDEFARFVDRLRNGDRLERPEDLLESDETTVSLGVEIEVECVEFTSRFEFGQYLNEKLDKNVLGEIEDDRQLWDWLTLFFIDVICPPRRDMSRVVGAQARYCLDPVNWQRYYRHLVASPWRICNMWSDDPSLAETVLTNAPHESGELYEQLASRLERITSRPVMQVARWLYIAPDTGRPKRGAGSKGRGSPRRFSDVLKQFERTYNIFVVSPFRLIEILPTEFDRFVPDQPA